jgi:hypothetical protein
MRPGEAAPESPPRRRPPRLASSVSFAPGEVSRFLACIAAAPAVLLLAHLLPASGPGLALRLAGAAACLLLVPGALMFRAAGWSEQIGVAVAASFALSLAVLALGLGLVFVVGGPVTVALTPPAVASVLATGVLVTRRSVEASERRSWAVLAVLGLGVAYAAVLWWAAGPLQSDGFFHAARVRKLAELPSLTSLSSVGEFQNGSLHPGYLFPLWHAAEALVARLAGVDVIDVVVYLPAVLVPLAFVLAYAAGRAVFESPVGGIGLVLAELAQFGFVRGGANPAGTGLFENLGWPREAALLLLFPALVALAFNFLTGGRRVVLVAFGAAAVALTAIHATYVPFAALWIAGFLVARVLLIRAWEPLLTRTAIALGVLLAPFGLFLLAVLPIADSMAAFTPAGASRTAELRHYGLAGFTRVDGWFGLSPSKVARGGPLVVGGLLAIPLAAFAARRLWAALVLGASLCILTLVLVPPLFTALSDALTLSQARRLPQFLPVAFAVVGGCAVLSRLRVVGATMAAGAGLLFVLLYFSYHYEPLGPAWVVPVAVAGGLAAIAAGAFVRTSEGHDDRFWLVAIVAFVLPTAVAGLAGVERGSADRSLTPGVIQALRSDVPAGDVVFSDRRTAYATAAYAPVYINASTPTHAADTRKNQLVRRSHDATRFFNGSSLSDPTREGILDRWRADWVLVDKRRPHPEAFLRRLRLVYEDGRFALYKADA